MLSINLHSPINKLSYGYAGINIVSALSKLLKVNLWPIGPVELEQEHIQVFQDAVSNAKMFDASVPSVRLYHQHKMDEWVPCSKKIGFPVFELDTFTPLEKHHLSYPDKLFVCSDWAKNVVITNFLSKIQNDTSDKVVNNVSVIPLGVDASIFKPQPISSGTTTFLNIGKLEKRKGLDILVKAFVEEFGPKENVRLLLACDNPFLNNEQKDKWRKLLMIDRRISLIPRQPSVHDMVQLINLADCLVFPSKAEGWNMPALEGLACGRHLIITDYSAHQMYANRDNAYMIPVSKLEPAYDDIWPVFHGQGNWAHIDDLAYQHLKLGMRWYHETKQSGDLSLNDAGIETAKSFSWDNTAQQILESV